MRRNVACAAVIALTTLACSPVHESSPVPNTPEAGDVGVTDGQSAGPSAMDCRLTAQAICIKACECTSGGSCNLNQTHPQGERELGLRADLCEETLSERLCMSDRLDFQDCLDGVDDLACEVIGPWRAVRVPQSCSVSGNRPLTVP